MDLESTIKTSCTCYDKSIYIENNIHSDEIKSKTCSPGTGTKSENSRNLTVRNCPAHHQHIKLEKVSEDS